MKAASISGLKLGVSIEDGESRALTYYISTTKSFFSLLEFSLFALERATGVTLKGARFPLEDETLMRGSRGLHNQATAMRIDLAYEAGDLMMIRALREEAPLEDGNEA